MAMYKPVISWCGTSPFCNRLQQSIQRNIPTQPISYRVGKLDRDVHVQCEFVPYSEGDLPQTAEVANVIGRPLVHIFVIAEKIASPPSKFCCQRLEAWLVALERRCLTEWMVLVIAEDCTGRPRSKIKNVIADRVKSDFCRQNQDRVLVLYDPFKIEDSLVKESWSKLLLMLGHLIKCSYQRLIGAYEIHIERLRRECRERKCNYFEFFSYQEELAAVYESLSVFDEALSQYDQLESLFEELVFTFCASGRSMPWLVNFVSLEFTRIDPLGIVNFSDPEKRAHVRAQMANLFEFQLYLFSRKCCYYSLMQEYGRIPEQAVRFLLGTLHQARLLKLDVPDLLVDAWVLLCCLQVRHIVQRYPDILNSGPMAEVCHLACRKLLRLGDLCGLMVERPGSEHIERMLQLRSVTAGAVAGDQLISGDSADQKMADWLSNPTAFRDAFHELADFVIGIYKHQGRTRFAAQASVEKADFYLACGDPTRAERFYKVALKAFKADAWPSLAADARLKILTCQRAQGRPRERTLKSLLHVAASPWAPQEEAAAAWAEVRAAMQDPVGGGGGGSEAAELSSPNRIRRQVRLPCEPLLVPTRLSLLADCPNRRQRALLRVFCAAPQPIDGVTIKCFGRSSSASSSTSPSASAFSSQAESPVRHPPPKPPKPPKPQSSVQLPLPLPLPPPLERSPSRLSARSLVPSDLVQVAQSPAGLAPAAASTAAATEASPGYSNQLGVVLQLGPDRCVVGFSGDGSGRTGRPPLASANSAGDSPDRRPLGSSPGGGGGRCLLASSVRLLPGENQVVLEASTHPLNAAAGAPVLLDPAGGDLLVQCGSLLFFYGPPASAGLCDDTWRDQKLRRRLLPSLELPPPTAPLLLHFEHRLAVWVRPGLIDPPDGCGRPELHLRALEDSVAATRAAPAAGDFGDSPAEEVPFTCRAEPEADEAWLDGGRATFRLAVASLPAAAFVAEAELRYLRPVLFSHFLHSAGPKSYLAVHLRPNEELNETLLVSDPQLSLKSAKLLCNIEETLAPGCAIAYLWELPDRMPLGPLRLSCTAQRALNDSRAVVSYTFRAAA